MFPAVRGPNQVSVEPCPERAIDGAALEHNGRRYAVRPSQAPAAADVTALRHDLSDRRPPGSGSGLGLLRVDFDEKELEPDDGGDCAGNVDGGRVDAPAPRHDADRILPTDIELHAPSGYHTKKSFAALGGVVAAGAAGFAVGSVIPGIGNLVGLIGGIVFFSVVGGGGAMFGSGVGALYDLTGGLGRGQQAHLDAAMASLAAQGVTFTPGERARLGALTPQDWRWYLHAPRRAFQGTGPPEEQRLARQAYREAFVLNVAKKGKDSAVRFRSNLLAPRPASQRGERALRRIEKLGGHRPLHRAYYSDDVGAADRLQHENRQTWSAYADQLEHRFGSALRQEFLGAIERERPYRSQITGNIKRRWAVIGRHDAAVGDLLARVDRDFDASGATAAREAAGVQRNRLMAGETTPSQLLTRAGRLGEDETRGILEAAWTAQSQARQSDRSVPAPPDLAALMAVEADRIGLERALIRTGRSLDTKDGWPVDLFSGVSGHVYQLCAKLEALDPKHLRTRNASTNPDEDRHRHERLARARGLARLGLTLQRLEVPEDQAAELLRLELAERLAGRGPDAPDRWSPALVDPERSDEPNDEARSDAQAQIARKQELHTVLDSDPQLRGITKPFVDKTFDKLMLCDGGAVAEGLMGDEAVGLRRVIKASVDAGDLLTLVRRGARDDGEAISCDRLDVPPEGLGTADLELQPWLEAGFNRPEAVAYARSPILRDRLTNLRPGDPQMRQFRGSHLTPRQIASYVDWRLPFNERTAPGFFVDRNRRGRPTRAGAGDFNTVYRSTYDTPLGTQERWFKPGQSKGGRAYIEPGQMIPPNLGMGILDRALGFDVIVPTEIGIVGDEVGLSMAHAGTSTAREHRHSKAVLPRDGAWLELYQNLDRLRRREGRRELCDRHGWKRISVNDDGQIVVRYNALGMVRSDPTFQRKSAALQIVDYLGVVRDRHADNYVPELSQSAGELRCVDLRGIDSDDAFGVLSPVQLHRREQLPVIDTEQVAAIKNLHRCRHEVTRELSEVLSEGKVQGFRDRLRSLYNRTADAEQRRGQIAIIEPGQWGTQTVTEVLMRERSFVSRDTQVRERKAAR